MALEAKRLLIGLLLSLSPTFDLCYLFQWRRAELQPYVMEDTALEPSPAPPDENSPCPSPSLSSPSVSLPSTPSSTCDPPQAAAPLCVISEGLGELTLVIDAEVAHRACQQVLQKVKLQQEEVGVGGVSNGEGRGMMAHTPATAETSSVNHLKAREDEPEGPAPGSVKSARRRQKHNPSKQSWLLRLFESKLFDVSMAISYLHKSKEPGVQAYIGNRLFSFPHEDVDFYLPQLLNMYIHMDEDVGDAIKPYVVGVVWSGWGLTLLKAVGGGLFLL